MNVSSQKKLAAKVLKVGIGRVNISNEKDVGDAITRNDIRGLIAKGTIVKKAKKGSCKIPSKHRRSQKKKGRRSGKGSKKGASQTKKTNKRQWIEKVRPLRKMLRELRDSGKIERSDYRKLYSMVHGGAFRSKKHLLLHLKEKEIIKKKGAENEKKKDT
ncbi:MAG: 50S ribosomal protein L19e [Candidatus Aenigmarchaeota archaeon]|nr:50S ribosomal protein L19e [Candidatus Aenigmarchaeota archaeon]